MRKRTVIMLHLVNIAFVLVFCMLYSSRHYDRAAGLMTGITSLTSSTFFISVREPPLPRYYTRMKNIATALGSWSFSVFFLGLHFHDHPLLLAGIVLISSMCMLALFYSRRLSRELFYLALVLRGEREYLEDVERYIKETGVYNNRVELIEPIYTTEQLSIVNESEWYSSTEFRKERLLTQLRKKELNHEHITFSCLLHGELRYLRPISSFIADYLSDWKVQTCDSVYSLVRLHIVRKGKETK
jgi:hypothetical protein